MSQQPSLIDSSSSIPPSGSQPTTTKQEFKNEAQPTDPLTDQSSSLSSSNPNTTTNVATTTTLTAPSSPNPYQESVTSAIPSTFLPSELDGQRHENSDDGDGLPPTQTTIASSQSSTSNNNDSPSVPNTQTISSQSMSVPNTTSPTTSAEAHITKTPRKLTAYPPPSASSTGRENNSLGKAFPTDSSPSFSRDPSVTRTPIAPKIAPSQAPSSSIPIAPKITSKAGPSLTSVGNPGLATSNHSLATPSSSITAAAMAVASAAAVAVTPSSRKRSQNHSGTPSANMASKLAALGPQQRIIQSSFPVAQHMSTYRKHKNNGSPQQPFLNQEESTEIYTVSTPFFFFFRSFFLQFLTMI